MNINSLVGRTPTAGLGLADAGGGAVGDSPQKIRDAASQFEGLLIAQVLKSVHDGQSEGWRGTGEDKSAGSAMELADDYFARALAARGGLGLARMVAAGLERRAASPEVSHSSLEKGSRPEGSPRTP